jgi:two-component system, NarL family, response regulator NreC
MIRVVLADDHEIVRQGLVSLLTNSGSCQVVGQAANGIDAVQMALEKRPNVLVVDISMPGLNGIEVVRRINQQLPECKTLVLTMHEEQEYVIHMVKAGASGYLVKDSASKELIDAIVMLSQGKSYFGQYASQILAEQYRNPIKNIDDPYGNLTEREREVFHCVIQGQTTKEVARKLDISVKTAENHRGRIMDKLDVNNTAELVRYAAKKGLLD